MVEAIGTSLREAREKKGLTLSDVQRITKIRTVYLEALESGQFAVLPDRSCERSFIRTYASAIGVDPKLFTTRYDNLRQEEARVQQALLHVNPPSHSRQVAQRIWATLNGTMEWLGL